MWNTLILMKMPAPGTTPRFRPVYGEGDYSYEHARAEIQRILDQNPEVVRASQLWRAGGGDEVMVSFGSTEFGLVATVYEYQQGQDAVQAADAWIEDFTRRSAASRGVPPTAAGGTFGRG